MERGLLCVFKLVQFVIAAISNSILIGE